MLFYFIRRCIYMVIALFIMSVVAFVIIELPPGDFVTSYVSELMASGRGPADRQAFEAQLRKQYGLDQPVYVRYFKWLRGVLYGDLGFSLAWRASVKELISERLPITLGVAIATLVFVYIVAVPIGIYSATHQYSPGDYFFTVIGFGGLAIPNFLFALVLMFFFYHFFGLSVGGFFSPQYETAAWSVGKFLDMLKHLPIPVIVVGTASTAGIIRIMRGCLLDELGKQYVITVRAKGVGERTLLFKYPVRVALNPIVSTMGWDIPWIISSQTITAVVLNLPTLGPLLLNALLSQDMFLAAAIILFLCSLTIIGTFISDVILAWLDPRIRYEERKV